MNSSKINEYLQILASIAVLVGLLLVAYEVRQINHLAEAETVRELVLSWSDISLASLEKDVSTLRLKSWENPDELTEEEILQLNEWMSLVIYQLMAEGSMERRGLGFDTDETFDEYLAKNFHSFFGYRFGRAWYLANRYWIPPQLTAVMDRELESLDGLSPADLVENIRENL